MKSRFFYYSLLTTSLDIGMRCIDLEANLSLEDMRSAFGAKG